MESTTVLQQVARVAAKHKSRIKPMSERTWAKVDLVYLVLCFRLSLQHLKSLCVGMGSALSRLTIVWILRLVIW